ncbi:hypothetical protein Moror_495 [Moniliophthora roreri MCA 2997]|uniref:Zn(2)-C6 fungal-type domain-containing protein n=2 Tax=Moniliophthora roreri TaxID=221103 RepID=V2Z267_MONRO|nr:hypothetical protein Moror_495 [Moniliophthora roreri MCA 2997]KAI3621792.1 hypothetical protein WG66_015174 [Moniliophthora roreri]
MSVNHLPQHAVRCPASSTHNSTVPSQSINQPSSSSHHSSDFARFMQEEDDKFYETFPGARLQQYQSWSTHRMGDGIFGGNYAFHYQSASSSLQPPPTVVNECLIEQPPIAQTEPVAYLEPVPCQSPHQVYSSPAPFHTDIYQPEITNQHDAEALYTYGESTPSGDVKHSQNYSSLAQATFDNISPCHIDGDCAPAQRYSPIQPLQHVPYTEPARQPLAQSHVEAPVMDYLPGPESPEALYSPIENATPPVYSNDPAIKPLSLPLPRQQPILPSRPPVSPIKNTFEFNSTEDSPALAGDDLAKPLNPRKRRRIGVEQPAAEVPRSFIYKIPLPKPNHVPAPKVPKRRPSTPQSSEKKSLALACFFCRGRKIACGPQDPNSPDRTCGQCHRRSLKCEYPTESRRGMRKRKSTVVTDLPPDEEQDLGGLGSQLS